MATDSQPNRRFTRGDSVRVRLDVPARFRPGQIGAVVAIDDVQSTVIYSVEYGDGTDTQIPHNYLIPVDLQVEGGARD